MRENQGTGTQLLIWTEVLGMLYSSKPSACHKVRLSIRRPRAALRSSSFKGEDLSLASKISGNRTALSLAPNTVFYAAGSLTDTPEGLAGHPRSCLITADHEMRIPASNVLYLIISIKRHSRAEDQESSTFSQNDSSTESSHLTWSSPSQGPLSAASCKPFRVVVG